MALLTADDVLDKKFQPTKFREGYDQTEVDEFLDEVVSALTTLGDENEELKAKLAAAERRVAELSGGEQPAALAPSPETEPETQPEQDAASPAAVPQAPPAEPADEPTSASAMLALAQRVHDEYVEGGKEEGERILHEARTEAERVVREAEDTHNRTLAQLEQERSLLERKIDELRVFERDYRTRLKDYLESLLSDVEGRGNVSERGDAGPAQSGR